ncbi:GNAT family N-acetyltransferase [Novosphingobium jiangmenense]|uniref:GNAT family N-acetyltransferase n=1 Tax=Novosphingobium jiangmenense TaxID=2791981 RepID=A0ABS0HDI2_9SPHN|nr:GNAT family N-acetyltransferase [Novosphingobium jiangmenense]MBF9150330.1 GNAT family N-acetyltransferase [Novosphingobium jiangmenense]
MAQALDVYHASLKEAQADPRLVAVQGASPFERLDWLALLAEHCLDETKAHVTVAADDHGIAALPWLDDGGQIVALANWYNFYVRFLGDQNHLSEIARSLPHARAMFAPLPEEDATGLAEAFRRAGWIVIAEPCDSNHILPVNGRSFAEYWADRPGALRETFRRKSRKGEVNVRLVTEFSQADWDAYEAIYKLSWKPGEGSPEFLRAWAQMESGAGRLRLGIAEVADQPVAAQFWTVEGGTAFIHKLAHDERFRKQSPGTLLSAAMFEHVIDRDGVSLIDFGTGDDPYKRDWMEEVRTRWRLRAWRKRAVRHWPSLLRALAARTLQPLVSKNRHG